MRIKPNLAKVFYIILMTSLMTFGCKDKIKLNKEKTILKTVSKKQNLEETLNPQRIIPPPGVPSIEYKYEDEGNNFVIFSSDTFQLISVENSLIVQYANKSGKLWYRVPRANYIDPKFIEKEISPLQEYFPNTRAIINFDSSKVELTWADNHTLIISPLKIKEITEMPVEKPQDLTLENKINQETTKIEQQTKKEEQIPQKYLTTEYYDINQMAVAGDLALVVQNYSLEKKQVYSSGQRNNYTKNLLCIDISVRNISKKHFNFDFGEIELYIMVNNVRWNGETNYELMGIKSEEELRYNSPHADLPPNSKATRRLSFDVPAFKNRYVILGIPKIEIVDYNTWRKPGGMTYINLLELPDFDY